MFAILSASHDRRAASSSRARSRKRPALEPLEGRRLMSLGPEFIGPINTTTRNSQFTSDNASSSAGSVVVWVDTFSPTDHDIRAQRFNSFGTKLGPEIVVSFSGLDESAPAVAIDGAGGFVVTWVQALPGGDTNVVARRFDSNGNAIGDVIPVGAGTFRESDPDVALDLAGNFVISYTRETNNNNPDVFAKRYNRDGQLLNVIDVATTTFGENHSSVAMTQDGRFDVAWERVFGPNDNDIYMSRYGPGGNLLGTNTISFSAAFDTTPSVSMDNGGNAVVAWERARDIKAVRVSAAGVMGGEINIASTANFEFGPSVALKPGGGGFVVAYESLTTTTARAMVAEVSAFDSIATFDAGNQSGGAVSINFFGDYLLTYTSADLDIRGRRGTLLF